MPFYSDDKSLSFRRGIATGEGLFFTAILFDSDWGHFTRFTTFDSYENI
jgi:hypothetical protein